MLLECKTAKTISVRDKFKTSVRHPGDMLYCMIKAQLDFALLLL